MRWCRCAFPAFWPGFHFTRRSAAAGQSTPSSRPPAAPGWFRPADHRPDMRRFILVLLLVLACVGGLVVWRGHQKAARDAVRAAAKQADIPVVTTSAITADVPVYVDGIGTVQALYTVNIRPMVDGPLVAVKFREGQDVKAGDVLALIDPRIYQAAYDQAVGKKAQDEANLRNAHLDLVRYD